MEAERLAEPMKPAKELKYEQDYKKTGYLDDGLDDAGSFGPDLVVEGKVLAEVQACKTTHELAGKLRELHGLEGAGT